MAQQMKSRSSISSSSNGLRSFVGRLVAFAALLLIVQIILSFWLEASFPELSALDRHLAARVDVIYFGDSVLHYHARGDRTRRGIPELLQELSPAYTVGSVDHPAYHFGLYRRFCEYIRRIGAAPKIIVIPITIRSFSAAWLRRPEYQFPTESIILGYRTQHFESRMMRAFLQPLLVFKAFDMRPEAAFVERAPMNAGNGPLDDGADVPHKRPEDISDDDIMRWLRGAYMYSLTGAHPRIQDMLDIMRAFRGTRSKLFFYLTPIDHETGTQLVGEAFSQRVRENVGLILRLSAAHDVPLSDLTFSLGADAFGWRGDGKVPDEHLAESGR